MSVNGIGTAGYPLTGYTARKMERSVEPGTVGFMEAVEEKAAQGRTADQNGKAFEMVGRGAPQEVKDAWMDAVARKIGCKHNDTDSAMDGYVTAWFMWQLQDDAEAAQAFAGESPKLLNNKLYQDQKINMENKE